MRRLICSLFAAAVQISFAATPPAGIPKFDLTSGPLIISERASPHRFINALGEKSGLWGFENGQLEGWIYPLKIFHEFELDFQPGRITKDLFRPGDSLRCPDPSADGATAILRRDVHS
jgi:hypothetical protein